MPEDRVPTEESVEWRRLNDYLWAGTCEDGPVGTIEHGRRYYAIDTLGSVIARCHDLPGAQAAFFRQSADGMRAADDHPRARGSRGGRHSARSHAA